MISKKFVLIILLVLFFFNLSAGLLTHLQFENDFKDRYGSNDGDNASSPYDVSFDTGKEGRGIYFDNSDYIEVGEGGFDPEGSSGYSISLWVKTGSSNTNSNCYIGKHNLSGGNEFLFGYFSGVLKVQVGEAYTTVSSTTEPVGVWTHYVVNGKTYSADTDVTVFRNGAQIWTGTINDVMTINSDSKPWVLGQEWDGSSQGGDDDDHNYFNFWDELHASSMSEAWVDPWSWDDVRDARYMTRENCDCNNTSCDSYMFDDYFVTVSTGPKEKKDQTNLSSYYHYCLRDDSGTPDHYQVLSLKSNSMIEPSKYDQDVYSRENLTTKIYQTYEMPAKIVTELFGIAAAEDGMVKYRDDEINFTLDGRRLFYKGTAELSPVEEGFPLSRNDYETLFIDDASEIAANLTTLPVVFDKISLDQTTSYIDDGINVDVESIKTNKISYIFVPVLDGVPMIFNKIEVQYDANGLYKIQSLAPYSVQEIAVADLKSQEEVLYEVQNELQSDKIPFDTRNIVYTIDKDGKAGIKYVYKDGKEKLIKTVSMEADYEK